MAIFEDVVAGEAATGLVVGLAAAVVVSAILPTIVSVGRPLLKGAIKGGIMLYERGQEVAAELGETVEDLFAEAKSELESPEGSMDDAVAAASEDIEAAAAEGSSSEKARGSRARRKSS
jgi:Protein of unknown function (DUF5132)